MPSLISARLLLGAVIVALFGVVGYLAGPLLGPEATMFIEPNLGQVRLNQTFTVNLIVQASIPVNVFVGELHFNPEVLTVEAIDYNTSIADLWAEKPWYENGAGTLNFIGGTTKQGGFIGTGELITVTFRTKALGDAAISLHQGQILKHDGLGTAVELGTPLDALFTVAETEPAKPTATATVPAAKELIHVVPNVTTDLNDDGRQSLADVSIFMEYLAKADQRGDFNQDEQVSMADLSILLNAR